MIPTTILDTVEMAIIFNHFTHFLSGLFIFPPGKIKLRGGLQNNIIDGWNVYDTR